MEQAGILGFGTHVIRVTFSLVVNTSERALGRASFQGP